MFLVFHDANAQMEARFDGFANMTLTYSDDKNYGFRSSILNKGRTRLSLAPDSLLGLQTGISFNSKLDLFGQVIVQDRINYETSQFVESLFLRYRLNRNINFKLGRFSTNPYLFTDSRYVGYSYNWIRTPYEMYSTAGAAGNTNGLEFNYIKNLSIGRLRTTLAYGDINFDDEKSKKIKIEYENFRSISLELSDINWRVQLTHAGADLNELWFEGVDQVRNLDLALPPQLSAVVPFVNQLQEGLIGDDISYRYTSLGVSYNFDYFDVIAEYALYESNWLTAQDSTYGYVSFAKNFGNTALHLTYGRVAPKDLRTAIDLNAAAESLPQPLLQVLGGISAPFDTNIQEQSPDQQSISLGFRWDFKTNWALKFQFDHNVIESPSHGLFLVSPDIDPSVLDGRVNVLSLGLTVTF